MTIKKYGKVIVEESGITFTDFIFITEVNHAKVLRWAIDKLIKELIDVEAIVRLQKLQHKKSENTKA